MQLYTATSCIASHKAAAEKYQQWEDISDAKPVQTEQGIVIQFNAAGELHCKSQGGAGLEILAENQWDTSGAKPVQCNAV